MTAQLSHWHVTGEMAIGKGIKDASGRPANKRIGSIRIGYAAFHVGIMHLTNTDTKGHDSAVASKVAAGAPEEIEITAEMLEAGRTAYFRYDLDDSSEEIVTAVFRAMLSVYRFSALPSHGEHKPLRK
jgi:hypothetical protein